MKITSLFLLFFCLITSSLISQNLQSPEQFLGYEIGTQFTRHADVVNYFKHVSENSELVGYTSYGKTNENRPLTYAVISSEENLKNIEEIRKAHLNNSILPTSNSEAKADKAIVWLSYNVHGNEASSTEAAMQTIYELVTSKKEWMQNTVVIMDPCINPDGRDRYVNWYNQVKTTPYNAATLAAEHNEPWPGGRANHYLFDLNRDWAWATQTETKSRLKIYNKWMPHIHVDFHEQGINEPYYFAPAAEPFHEIITPFQREFQSEIGKNHAKYFDKNGWLYFTKEVFDLLYPSYGDTYPTYMGAIGMTYEQAGGGQGGLGVQTAEGYELTLVDRVAHHFTTGISTVEIASQNTEKLNAEFNKFYKNEQLSRKSYVLNGSPDKIASLKALMDLHEIKYGNTSAGKIKGYNYNQNKNSEFTANENSLVITTDQPKGKMIKVLFEPNAKLSDSLTYDITAWSLPYAFGLEAVATDKLLTSTKTSDSNLTENTVNTSATGFISKWDSMEDARFLSDLLKEGIKVRFSTLALENGEEKFKPGSLIITKSDNRNLADFNSKLTSIANTHGRKLTAATTGFSKSGPDFGSSDIKIINQPRVGVLRGDAVSSLNFGEIWHYFEKDLHYPISPIDIDYFNKIDLSKLDILILPEGRYSNLLDKAGLERLTNWIKDGGKVIAIGSAVGSFADKAGFNIKENKVEENSDSTAIVNLIPYKERERENIKDLITGIIVKTNLDKTHPMAFGYSDTYFSLKLSGDSYKYLKDGYNIAYLKDAPEVVSGFAGSEAAKNLKNSMIFGEEPMGKGSIIYMVDNPLFRAFWENGKLFFANAIFFVNNDTYRMKI
ncbi:MAG TPA: M14 metallopeptidase family protein [Gillisia sp.]|nr:M14 metallopeptidase family protein [Gillisia sp.]